MIIQENQLSGKKNWISGELAKIQNNKQQAAAYFYLILTFFSVSFFGFFVLRPAISTISNLQKKLSDNRTIYQGLQEKLATIQQLDTQYQSIQTQIPLIYEAIPNTPQIPHFTRQVEKISLNNNITLKNFQVSTVELFPLESGNFSFTMDAEGTEQNINSFIESLSNSSRVITIDKISSGKSKAGNVLELSLSGKAYFD